MKVYSVTAPLCACCVYRHDVSRVGFETSGHKHWLGLVGHVQDQQVGVGVAKLQSEILEEKNLIDVENY